MGHYLDLDNWHRRDLFEFFRDYRNPYFNICTRIDCTPLVERLRAKRLSISLGYHYVALRAANDIENFHYRLEEGGKVFIHDVINGGTTVLLPNESFSYAYFDYVEDFDRFSQGASESINKIKNETSLKPTMRYDLIYFTTLPWMSFTSFAHARTPGRGESIPRIAFGKFLNENGRALLPISVEVHHALMDGLHVGRFLSRMEELLAEPETYIK